MILPTFFADAYNQAGILEIAASVILLICGILIFFAVAVNFAVSEDKKKIHKEKKSIVETGSMLGYFALYFIIIISRIGTILLVNEIRQILIVIGLVIVITGTAFNILGRIRLGNNWGNQVIIYNDHSLVNDGAYRVVRHPLYASLIWIFIGGALIYANMVALLTVVTIFIPFMHYRARQEEQLLIAKFSEYNKYKESVGMFFPKVSGGKNGK